MKTKKVWNEGIGDYVEVPVGPDEEDVAGSRGGYQGQYASSDNYRNNNQAVIDYYKAHPDDPNAEAATANAKAALAASKPVVSEDVLREYLTRDDFKYDSSQDPLFLQYRDRYMSEGKTAMKDTIGKAAALTGGYANSYATAVGQQVYSDYAARAADKIPELEQAAYDRWRQQGDDMLKRYELLRGRENEEAAAEAAAAEAEREDKYKELEYELKYLQTTGDLSVSQYNAETDRLKAEADAAYKDGTLSINEYKAITDRIQTGINQQNADTKAADLAAHVDGSYYKDGGSGSGNGSGYINDTIYADEVSNGYDAYVSGGKTEKALDEIYGALAKEYGSTVAYAIIEEIVKRAATADAINAKNAARDRSAPNKNITSKYAVQ